MSASAAAALGSAGFGHQGNPGDHEYCVKDERAPQAVERGELAGPGDDRSRDHDDSDKSDKKGDDAPYVTHPSFHYHLRIIS
jgi:hypothetical protein